MVRPKKQQEEVQEEQSQVARFDFTSTMEKIRASLKKDERRQAQFGLGNTITSVSKDPNDYIEMPSWWKDHFGVVGLQFGKIVQIAGDADTGKTSLALEAMLRAQQQGHGIIYVETEQKTGDADLIAKGIDPLGVMTVRTSITEEAFDGALRYWSQFFKDYPDKKLLVVYDSYGNTVSQRDATIDMTKKDAKVGGAAKTNRMGLNTMVARMMTDPAAVLIVNYTYANIGSKGNINAGGKALNLFSMLILQSVRTGWITATRAAVKVRVGAKVRWKVYKNHYAKTVVNEEGQQILLPAFIDLSITADGFNVLVAQSEEEEESEE